MATLNLSIPEDMKAWIEEQVAVGQFADTSAFLRNLIKKSQNESRLIEQALIDGESSGVSEKTIADIVEERKNHYKHNG